MGCPLLRPRRTRQCDARRRMVRETRLTPEALIYPLFAVPGRGVRHAVASMPGVSQLSVDELVKDAKAAAAAGVPAVLLFAAPAQKDARASAALDAKGLAAQAITAVKDACPQLLVWADVCLCGATDHGHCGHVLPAGSIDNDSSVETLAQVALNYARAGADAVAPSDMMDGRVPVVGYQVRGEFSVIKAAAERGWIDERAAVLETLTGIQRAGADLIITYWAPDVARWLRG